MYCIFSKVNYSLFSTLNRIFFISKIQENFFEFHKIFDMLKKMQHTSSYLFIFYIKVQYIKVCILCLNYLSFAPLITNVLLDVAMLKKRGSYIAGLFQNMQPRKIIQVFSFIHFNMKLKRK